MLLARIANRSSVDKKKRLCNKIADTVYIIFYDQTQNFTTRQRAYFATVHFN